MQRDEDELSKHQLTSFEITRNIYRSFEAHDFTRHQLDRDLLWQLRREAKNFFQHSPDSTLRFVPPSEQAHLAVRVALQYLEIRTGLIGAQLQDVLFQNTLFALNAAITRGAENPITTAINEPLHPNYSHIRYVALLYGTLFQIIATEFAGSTGIIFDLSAGEGYFAAAIASQRRLQKHFIRNCKIISTERSINILQRGISYIRAHRAVGNNEFEFRNLNLMNQDDIKSTLTGKVDMITLNHVIEHLPEDSACSLLVQLLTSSPQVLAISAPYYDSLHNTLSPGHIQEFSPKSLLHLVETAIKRSSKKYDISNVHQNIGLIILSRSRTSCDYY